MTHNDDSETIRKPLHARNIDCRGFERSDGLWDVEATLTDTKYQSMESHERGTIPPGEPIHRMSLRVTLDLDLVIRDIQVDMDYTPFRLCKSAGGKMAKLIGLRIGSGWMRTAKERIGRQESCTHVMELLGPISTTAYQTMHWAIEEREKARGNRSEPAILDQCISLSRDTDVVKAMWPEFYSGKPGERQSGH